MMKPLQILISVLIFFGSCSGFIQHAFGQEKIEDFKIKALFVYQFTKYVTWPRREGPFRIVVIDPDSRFSEFLVNATKSKKVNDSDIEIIHFQSPPDHIKGEMLVLMTKDRRLVREANRKRIEKGILVVGDDGTTLNDGVMIQLKLIDHRLKFLIDKGLIEKSDLSVSSRLLQLATEVK